MKTNVVNADALKSLETVRDWVRWTMSEVTRTKAFLGHGTDDLWDEALMLVLSVLDLPWDADPRVLDARLLAGEKDRLLGLIERRTIKKVPLAYLTQQAWFAGLPFYIDERALIPRSPIAELIESGFEPWLTREPLRILDLCTGGGCIAVACAMLFPETFVDGVDLSSDALEVAAINQNKHGVEESRLRFLKSDVFASLDKNNQYDLIVSNPPYVDAADMAALPDEYAHEPEMALAAGYDGLDIVRRILKEANDYLAKDGVLIVEVGNSCEAMDEQYPQLPLVWLEFAHGGHGVFMISAVDLARFRSQI